MKACVCFNKYKQKTMKILPKVMDKLGEFSIATTESKITNDCDVVITIGGDGTILDYGKQAAKLNKPLLGINTGRLGFMATLECHELDKLKKLKEHDYSISKRALLSIEINKNCYTALNDVVFMKNKNSKLPEFRVFNISTEVLKVRADGIIFSTPTGSTAYALSAGGPIIEPEADCIEFTPLCAHSLFSRPMIFSGESDIAVKYDSYESGEVYVSIDGGESIYIAENEKVNIKKSNMFLDLIDIDGNSFYNAIHNKLMQPLK